MNFINNSFWLTDESHIQFTPIARRNKINRVKTCQNLMHHFSVSSVFGANEHGKEKAVSP